ncbi:hypothetical protein, partial [Modestobacter marinus]|uniref:hypothetical protein n=1 Tax=Modestobacter marinus TaxID=477641 RepID=UPI0031E9BC0A
LIQLAQHCAAHTTTLVRPSGRRVPSGLLTDGTAIQSGSSRWDDRHEVSVVRARIIASAAARWKAGSQREGRR